MFTWRTAMAMLGGLAIGYGIIWASSGELKVRDFACAVVAWSFIFLAAWVFKSVEREPAGEQSSDVDGRTHS